MSSPSAIRLSVVCWLLTLGLPLALRGAAGCPPADQLLAAVDVLGLERASRTARFEIPPPSSLYREAVDQPERIWARREGTVVVAATVVELPVEILWQAVNDEDHHDLEGLYIPVKQSTVLEGQARGQSRLLFQTFQRWGVGRWWVSRVQMNESLYRASGGRLWEVFWTDEIESADRTKPPVADVVEKIPALYSSHGAWVLASLADECTLVDYFTRSEPGGVVKLGQLLFAKRGVRMTLEGLIRLAREHIPSHNELDFVRPDGSPLRSQKGEDSGSVERIEVTPPAR